MVASLTWRDLLGEIIENSRERQHLATTLKVNPITLTRWANGISNPRRQHFQLLLDALPEYRKQLRQLMAQEYTDFFGYTSEETHNDTSQFSIPSSFYGRILNIYVTTPPILRFSAILNLILEQIISQFDPNASSGIKVFFAQFIAPNEKDQPVQSLRVIADSGTPFETPILERQTMFLGAESQIGFALLSNHMIVIEDFSQEQQTLHFPEMTIEKSAVACPMQSIKGVAGGILISSILPNYFTPSLQSLLQSYVDLCMFSFEAEDFYPHEKIRLGVMPTYQQQEPYLKSFEVRVRETLLQAARKQQLITRSQAEAIVWKDLEQEFLKITSSAPILEK